MTLCLIGAILRCFSFLNFFFFTVHDETRRSLAIRCVPASSFSQWLPIVSFSSSFSSSPSSLHILHNSSTSPFFYTKLPSSLISSHHLILPFHSLIFSLDSLHLLQWYPRPKRLPMSFSPMHFSSPTRVE